MLDFELYGLNAGGYHLTNLLLHIANVLLFFFMLKRMTGALWRSGFVAVLFALHPLHVESVAWVTERKDVLSTFFWVLTFWVYVRYVEHPSPSRYLLGLVTFTLGLMAKPMLITLPFVLLLFDYWPLGRFDYGHDCVESDPHTCEYMNLSRKRLPVLLLLREKVPFFIIAGVFSVVTFLAQQSIGAVRSLDKFPIESRIANALVSYVSYIGKMFWPHHLAIPYPHPLGSLPMWKALGAGILLTTLSILVIGKAARYRYLIVGWLWYLATLFPVIGLVQVGSQAMADRFTYVPLIGLFMMVAWGVPELVKTWRHRQIVLGISASILLFALMICTWLQVGYWKNSITLFTHVVNVTANNSVAHYSLGLALGKEGRLEESIRHSSEALRINPEDADTHMNLGVVLAMQGKLEQAVVHFNEALRLDPDYTEARDNLEKVLLVIQKRDSISESILGPQ
jgi:hypothetical protein